MSGQKLRSEIDKKYKWKIDLIYSSDELWEKDCESLISKIDVLKTFQGNLNNSACLKEYLIENERLNRQCGKLYMYAALKNHEDMAETKYQNMLSKIEDISNKISEYTSYFSPEILGYDEEFIFNMISSNEELKKYEFFMKNIFKKKNHILSKDEENILSIISDSFKTSENIYEVFTNADMTFGKIIDENKKEVELTNANYSEYIESYDRDVRKSSFKQMLDAYKRYQNMFAVAYISDVKNFANLSKIRKFDNSLEYCMNSHNIPTSVYHTTVDTIKDNLPLLHRYVKMKRDMLGLDEMHMYDMYVPMIKEGNVKTYSIEEAIDVVKESLSPLGKEYVDIVSNGIDNGWIDFCPNKGKMSGAYSWGTYDTMPYILLNYNGKLDDVSTLAHELGHSMHSYYSGKNQDYIYSGYTIFSAEIASTVNEMILADALMKKATTKEEQLMLINHELEMIRSTVFRQGMFADFERIVHRKVNDGEQLSYKELKEIYHSLQVEYFGKDMIVDDEIDMEWARIPHFYSSFYVYQYATGYSAASLFKKSILDGEDGALDRYVGFLKSGGNGYTIDILKKAGVDMTTSEPVQSVMDRFEYLINEFERLVNEK